MKVLGGAIGDIRETLRARATCAVPE